MKLRPGCGCAVLVLALVNLVAFLFWIVAAFVGEETTGATIAIAVILGFVFLANGVVCALVGWGAVRAAGFRLPSMLEGEEGEE